MKNKTAIFMLIAVMLLTVFVTGCTTTEPTSDADFVIYYSVADENECIILYEDGVWEDSDKKTGTYAKTETEIILRQGGVIYATGTWKAESLTLSKDGKYLVYRSDNYVTGMKKVYALAVDLGYNGTLEDLIEAFKGDSAYDIAKLNGYTGSQKEWLQTLVGAQGEPGELPTIVDGYWYIGGVNTGVSALGQKGDKGDRGEQGEQGAGITGIYKTGSGDYSDTYRIVYADGQYFDFVVNNGAGITSIDVVSTEGKQNTFEITYANGLKTTFVLTDGQDGQDGANGENGVSITNISKASSEGDVDTYTITMSNGSTYTFTVTNGKDGADGKDGQDGTNGTDGTDGKDGTDGTDGKSAYQIAVEKGFTGTEQEWLNSLVGKNGINGTDGTDGKDGTNGTDGKSAYQIALDNGFTGTEQEWLNSLVGKDGTNGTDGTDGQDGVTVEQMYQFMVEKGFEGSYEDFINLLAPKAENLTYVSDALLSSVLIQVTYSDTTAEGTANVTVSGSGVIYQMDKDAGDAYIITNHHVAAAGYGKDNEQIAVFLYGNSQGNIATYVGGCSEKDIAVLKIKGSDIIKNSVAKVATFIDSETLVIGQEIIAVGNTGGYGINVLDGIVRKLDDGIASEGRNYRAIRMSALINHGNSGGGVFDVNGNVVAIASAGDTDGYHLQWAIPSNIATAIADKLIAAFEADENHGEQTFKRADMGFSYEGSSSTAAIDSSTGYVYVKETVSVTEVTESGIADGKLEAGDIIVSVKVNDGETKTINHKYTLDDIILTLNADDEVTFTVARVGVEQEVTVTVTEEAMQELA